MKKALNKTAKIKHLVMAFGLVLFAAICFYVLRPRKPNQAKQIAPTSPRTDSLARRWRNLKPIALLVALLVSVTAMAQTPSPFRNLTPDCCLQAVKQQSEIEYYRAKHRTADSLYRETYRTGQELLDAKDSQIEQAASQVAIAQTALLNAETKVAELEKENKKWVPKTWLGRQLRYIERGAAIGFGVAVGVLLLAK